MSAQVTLQTNPLSTQGYPLDVKTKFEIITLLVCGAVGAVLLGIGGEGLVAGVGGAAYLLTGGGLGVILVAVAGVAWVAHAQARAKDERNLAEIEGDTAMQLVEDALENAPKTEPLHFCGQALNSAATKQPANLQLPRVHRLYSEAEKRFRELFAQHQSLERVDVLEAAHKYARLAYVLSRLALEDLPAFAKACEFTQVQALTKQESYLFHTFFIFPAVYHELRAVTKGEGAFSPGTHQNTWRRLFKHYGELVRLNVNLREVERKSMRHTLWTQEDTGEGFDLMPDTLPWD